MTNKGFAEITAILFALIAFVVLAAGAFYFLKGVGQDPSRLFTSQKQTEELPISDSDKTTTIEAELESTQDVDFSADFTQLEEAASQL